MALAATNTRQFNERLTLGVFREKTRRMTFEYATNDDPDTMGMYPHLVFVGPRGNDTRYAHVLKTVAYIAVDENDDGFLIEKWDIVQHRTYNR